MRLENGEPVGEWPVEEWWDEFGVEDPEGSVEWYDNADEAIDVILFRKSLYGCEGAGWLVTRKCLALQRSRPEKQPVPRRAT